ncbi:dual specificity protein phosphatase PHS1-like [Ananas comosus]|uniref:Dual specificity protein phosphatase PHS1-like n=1 Tax=Ananas comosus TaxID=4615 RepID=A0A6P5H2U2_ANACO|nr:dual specificity protein phosphatase PHS1-like [Ananas comosus]
MEFAPSPSSPQFSAGECNSEEDDANVGSSHSSEQVPELSLWERLGKAAMLDIESNDFSWSSLSSLYHTKHTSSTEPSEDELNKALEVTVNSGGVVFIALFNTSEDSDTSPKEAAAVLKFASSRMATQSERLGYEFAKWLGVRTPQARVIHNASSEWQQIKDATEKARCMAVSNGDEVSETTCSELLDALELSRCLFLMNYIHGSPLLENSTPFDSREAAEKTAEALGKVLMLDLILRNEDRLRCRWLGWRGNYGNLLVTDEEASANMDLLDEVFYDSTVRRYMPEVIRSHQKERRAISVNGRLSSDNLKLTSEVSDSSTELNNRPKMIKQVINDIKSCDFYIVAIDSGVPRRPPVGKRARDQENYPKLVELTLNNWEYSSNLLYELSFGKLGFPGPDEATLSSPDCSCSLIDSDMIAVVGAFRGGFKGALRDLQGFHIFLLTLYQKLDGLLRCLLPLISKFGESDKDDSGASDSPSFSAGCSSTNSPFPACKGNGGSEINVESSDNEIQKLVRRQSHGGSRESFDLASSFSRESWNVRYFRGNGDQNRSLRLTMKLRDFNKFAKVDAELNKELEQWNEMLRTDVIKLCQENNFNTGFFEGSDSNIAIDAYELKVRLEHILERISMISDAASTERPSQITDNLYIGGALAARSMYTLQHLGITHILCLCSNEIGQADSQYPYLFDYRNFSIRDTDDEDISDLFQETSDFIDYVEYLGGKVLVHCFEGRSRSATVVLAYLILRKNLTLLEAWNMLRKVHRRAQPNDGFARILLDLDKRLHGKISMEWQHRRPTMKVCPICGKNAGLSSSSLKLHLQKSHKKISSGSVDSAMTLEIQKAIEALKISRSGSVSPTQKQLQSQSQSFIENLAS